VSFSVTVYVRHCQSLVTQNKVETIYSQHLHNLKSKMEPNSALSNILDPSIGHRRSGEDLAHWHMGADRIVGFQSASAITLE